MLYLCKEEKLKSWDAGTNWDYALNKLAKAEVSERKCVSIPSFCLEETVFLHCEGQTAEVQEFMAWWWCLANPTACKKITPPILYFLKYWTHIGLKFLSWLVMPSFQQHLQTCYFSIFRDPWMKPDKNFWRKHLNNSISW